MKKLSAQIDKKCCGTCFFFDDSGWTDDSDKPYGSCLRFPPVYVGGKDLQNFQPEQWEQPSVYPDATVCGEWKQG